MANTRVDYEELANMISELYRCQDDLQNFFNILHEQRQSLQDEALWRGSGANAFYLEADTASLASFYQLVLAIEESSKLLTKAGFAYDAAEQDGEREFAKHLAEALKANPDYVPWDFMDSGFWFGYAGNGFGLLSFGIEYLGKALIAAGMLEPTPFLEGLGVALTIGSIAIESLLTYGEHYDEEPNFFRGMGIAIGSELIESIPGLDVAFAANDLHQFLGKSEIIASYLMAENYNIPDGLRDSLETTARNYNDVLERVDLSNLSYDVSRVLTDIQVLPTVAGFAILDSLGVPGAGDLAEFLGVSPEQVNIVDDTKHLLKSVVDLGTGIWDYPDAFIDTQVTLGVSQITHWVNESGMPPELQNSISNTAEQFVDYVEENSLLDMAGDAFQIVNPFD